MYHQINSEATARDVLKKAFLRYSGTDVFLWIPPHTHIVCLTIAYHFLLEFWSVVDTWFFAHWRNQRAVTCLENVNQLNIRRGKKQGLQLSHRQPPTDSYNPNPYPDPSLLRWVFSRGIFPETFAHWVTASVNWLWLWNSPILFSWN